MIGLGLLLGSLRRAGKLVPLARLVVIGELVVLAFRHFAKLHPTERTRLLALVRRARGRPSVLDDRDREELLRLVAGMEPQVFFGHAVRRLSPVPVPRRVAEGGANAVGRALRGRR